MFRTLRLVFAGAVLSVSTGLYAGEVSSNEQAAQMMTRAHDARAVWKNFPGFIADIVVADGNESHKGQITVTPDFNFTLAIADEAKKPWLNEKLVSAIGHRKASPAPKYDVAFADDNVNHPLGRMIRNDKQSSHFRIQEDVITELIRRSEKSWFEISTLEVWRTEEGTHLPRTTSVSYRDPKTGDLQSNRTNFFSWTRVGGFDLPNKLTTIVTSEKGDREVRFIEFTGHALTGE